jgi:enamine deaminase RidA (YjgF/YER057c/UK114 family)
MVTADEFTGHPAVADGASDLLRDIFGKEKMAVRLVIGVANLPLGVPIELEVIFELEE